MNRTRRFLLALAAGLTLWPAAAQDFATNTPQPTAAPTATLAPPPTITTPAQSVTVIFETANLRAEPNAEAEVLTQVYRGSSFPVIAQVGAGAALWYQVQMPDGLTGWLFNTTSRIVITWTPRLREFDGVMMALVPPGCFVMGDDDGEPDEQPAASQCFDRPFWIDATEVTNRAYGSAGYFDGDRRPR
ncbi:MAG: SH3 domain-containing protein, partial [Chloroflexi bacterium]|nr:SH3 domain-containing protein [Chloroflexota bacterium]